MADISKIKLPDNTEVNFKDAQARLDLANKITAPSSPSSGQFLVYNGTAWVAQTVPNAQGVNF